MVIEDLKKIVAPKVQLIMDERGYREVSKAAQLAEYFKLADGRKQNQVSHFVRNNTQRQSLPVAQMRSRDTKIRPLKCFFMW